MLRKAGEISAGIALLGVILSATWWLTGPRVSAMFQDVSGVSQFRIELEKARADMEANSGAIHEQLRFIRERQNGVIAKLDEIAPVRALQYDPYTSTAAPSCVIGEWCSYRIRVRRTQAGLDCVLEDVTGILVNHNGAEYPVELKYTGTRLGTTYTNIDGQFRVSAAAVQAGLANFYLIATYRDCLGQPVVREPSPVMRTMLETPK